MADATASMVDLALFDDACVLGPVPLAMDKVLRRFLTNLFKDPANLENKTPAVQQMVWTPDASTGIAIETVGAWVPELTEKRPGVIIKGGGWKRVRVGIDDRMIPEAPDGKRYHGNFWQCSHTLLCIAGSEIENKLLLAEVYRAFNQFGPALREKLQLMRFEVMEAGEQLILEGEARENFLAPVNLAYAYQEFWRIEELSSPVLAGVQMGVTPAP